MSHASSVVGHHIGQAPCVVISVRPVLLESALTSLLRGQGWQVTVPSDSDVRHRSIAAALVSQDMWIAIRGMAPRLTVVLPDDQGEGGRTIRGNGQVEPLMLSELGELLDVLASVR